MSVTIIINPISGGVRPGQARARAELASAVVDTDGETAEVFVTEARGHARELARAAVRRGTRLVISWGGDGTLNEIASALAFQDVPLGLVPAGSGNGLARELGVNAHPGRAIADAIRARPRTIDLGQVDDRLFVNVAGFGLDAYIAAQFDRPGNRRRGFVGYAAITARALASYAPRTYTITTPEGRQVSRAILVTVANSPQFGNGARIAPRALLDDGRLDLVVVEERGRWRTALNVPRLFNGTVEKIPGCSISPIQQATIESDLAMVFHVDGEPVEGGTRLQVRVVPAALRVAVR
jgi:YegS/Rv2252/BmrU family lipid kinase